MIGLFIKNQKDLLNWFSVLPAVLAFGYFSLWLSPSMAFADEDPAVKVYEELCRSGSAEGSYIINVGKAGRFRVSLVCTGPSGLAVGLRGIDPPEAGFFSLVHTAVDDDVISFLTFHIAADDAKTMSSASTDIRLKLDIPSLKTGLLKGTYRTLNSVDPVPVSARREASFPNLLAMTNHSVDYKKSFTGSFNVPYEAAPFVLTMDVLGGIQRININLPGVSGYVLHNGLPAAGAGDVFYATSGVDDGTFGRVNLLHIRGRFLNENEVEIYYLDTRSGLLGPFRAKRRKIL
jgi:hypothetical protein